MKVEIRVQSQGQYQLWVAANDTDWTPLFRGKGSLTAEEICATLAQSGLDLFPEELSIIDAQWKRSRMPRELRRPLANLFLERELRRHRGH